MEDIQKAWETLKISEEENEVVLVEGNNNAWNGVHLQLCLAGKLLTKKKFNDAAMKSTLCKAWNLDKEATVRGIGDNRFIFQFLSLEDKNSVLERGPWCFDDQLLLLSNVNGEVSPSQIVFSHSLFWVHLFDVPLGYRNEASLKAFGEKLGGYVTHDKQDPLMLGEYLRVRINFNISKPLLRRIAIQVGGKKHWIGVKYERLPSFCYCCGRLGHIAKDCSDSTAVEISKEHMQFGVWLHATKSKRRLRPSRVELERESIWLKLLEKDAVKTPTPEVNVGNTSSVGLEGDLNKATVFGSTSEEDILVEEDSTPCSLYQKQSMLFSENLVPYGPNLVEKSIKENTTLGPSPPNTKSPINNTKRKVDVVQVSTTSDDTSSNTEADLSIEPSKMGLITRRMKRKAGDQEALSSPLLEGSGPGKKTKSMSGIDLISPQVANMEVHVREEQ